jgi:hypothetical protein
VEVLEEILVAVQALQYHLYGYIFIKFLVRLDFFLSII